MVKLTAFYAALSALLFVWLSINVIKLRRRFQVRLGDGGNVQLKTAISAQSNAAQYLPFALLLMAILELNAGHFLLLHVLGLMLLAGRLIHARGILNNQMPLRVRGMQLTFLTLIAAATLNLLYLLV